MCLLNNNSLFGCSVERPFDSKKEKKKKKPSNYTRFKICNRRSYIFCLSLLVFFGFNFLLKMKQNKVV